MKIKLTLKFTVLMLVPLAGLAFTGYVAYDALKQLADFHVRQQAKLLMEAMAATRDYTNEHIKPKLDYESKDGEFNKETVPAFAAHETLKYIIMDRDIPRTDSPYDTSLSQYDYKEASDNPTNSWHKANEDEVEIIRGLSTKSFDEDTINRKDKSYWYFARPIVAKKSEGCMDCHSEKEKAPASMLRAYGQKIGGFNWQEGVVAAQIVYVPRAVPDLIAHNAVRKIAWIIFVAG